MSGILLSDKILEELKAKAPTAKVWKIFYPMREDEPIKVSIIPGTAKTPIEFEIEGKKVEVVEEERPRRG